MGKPTFFISFSFSINADSYGSSKLMGASQSAESVPSGMDPADYLQHRMETEFDRKVKEARLDRLFEVDNDN